MVISWVEIRDGMLLALASIKENKLRAGLTILGVLIGVASVIGMASIIAGLDKMVLQEIENLGSNVIYITKFPPNTEYDKLTEEERSRKDITFEEAEAIRQSCPSVSAISPQNHYRATGGNIVKYKANQANRPDVFGAMPDYVKVNNQVLAKGRFFNDFDIQRRAMICVIGSDIAKGLFQEEDPLGKAIRVNARLFEVVGVMEEKPPFMGHSENNFVIMPYSTFAKLHPWEKGLFLAVSARSAQLMPQAIDEITSAVRRVRGVPYNKPDDFAVWTQENMKEIANNIAKYIYIAMIVISSVGLMVGGVGVMNIMLVSVTERTREIGVRKAIGARKINILIQFLTEAITLSGSGGVIGIFVGILLALAVKLIFSMPFTVSILWILIGFSVSVGVGLTAGIYPAYKAARVDPIISLRYE